jgi:hypothetical protein
MWWISPRQRFCLYWYYREVVTEEAGREFFAIMP